MYICITVLTVPRGLCLPLRRLISEWVWGPGGALGGPWDGMTVLPMACPKIGNQRIADFGPKVMVLC